MARLRGISASAGGGGGGGGVSLYDISMTSVDLTDGTWTLLDPDSLIASVTYDTGFNTVTWNELAVGSADYNWGNGANHRGPRWYKNLTIESNNITAGDFTIFNSFLQIDNSVDDFDQQIVIGLALDPTSTVANTIQGAGGAAVKILGGGDAYGSWAVSGIQTSAGFAVENCLNTLNRGARHAGNPVYEVMDSSGLVIRSNGRNTNSTSIGTDSSPEFIIVGLGTRSNTVTITSGEQQKFKLGYSAITLNVFPGP